MPCGTLAQRILDLMCLKLKAVLWIQVGHVGSDMLRALMVGSSSHFFIQQQIVIAVIVLIMLAGHHECRKIASCLCLQMGHSKSFSILKHHSSIQKAPHFFAGKSCMLRQHPKANPISCIPKIDSDRSRKHPLMLFAKPASPP